jgi:heavy metal sensor kinase
MKNWNIRIRLTLLFAGLSALFMVAFSATVLWLFGQSLQDSLDRELRGKVEALAAAYEMNGDDINVEMDEHARGNLWADSLAQIQTPEGKVLFRTHPEAGEALPLPSGLRSRAEESVQFFTEGTRPRGELRSAWLWDERYRRPIVIGVAAPLETVWQARRELLRVMILAGCGLVAISGLVGWFVTGRLLHPLGAMASKARQISAKDLSERLEVRNRHDEVGQLATTLNEMIGRLGASFEQMRRFTSDASHELRTPLTCMRSEVEVALQDSRTPEEYREVLGSILEEVDRLTRLSDSLLTLAKLDAGHISLNLEPVDIAALLAEAADRIRVQAEAKGITLDVRNASVNCKVQGDARLLEQVLLNLLDNAIKYGGQVIDARARATGGEVRVTIRDSGSGIPAEHLDHLFERFYRVDKSRSRELGGAGLGLSLARHFVELHGGRIEVRSEKEKGTTFEVIVPEIRADSARLSNHPPATSRDRGQSP